MSTAGFSLKSLQFFNNNNTTVTASHYYIIFVTNCDLSLYLTNLTISINQGKYLNNLVLKPKGLLHFLVEEFLGDDFREGLHDGLRLSSMQLKCKQKHYMLKKEKYSSSSGFMVYSIFRHKNLSF